MKKTYFLLLIGILQFCPSFSQYQKNFRHFGLFGDLYFTSGTPALFADNPLHSNKGNGSLSDEATNRRFLPAGLHIWHSNHASMLNGTGQLPDASITEQKIFCAPGKSDRDFIFLLDNTGGEDSLNSITVDMPLNPRLGDMTINKAHFKNTISEKIEAIYHCGAPRLDFGNKVMFRLTVSIQRFFHPLFSIMPRSILANDFISSDTIICRGECINFTYTGTPSTTWQWTFEGAEPSFSADENPEQICYFNPGNYLVKLIVSDGIETDTSLKSITVFPLPIVDAGQNITVVDGSTVNLSATGNLNSYSWMPETGLSDAEIPNPVATLNGPAIYYVSGVDSNNCTGTDSIIIEVTAPLLPCGEVFIPNAFSPDNNGENDFECVIGKCITEMTFVVYNRWGEKVFETTDQDICWDGTYEGKLLNSAEFVYILRATLVSGDEVKRKGTISLIR